mmetsp:Transcript_1252/g.2642  ORF Transcript_1252/g.2642 Transcript_1252/m.2642 type:complete len:610 (-) Transcript_1252:934-2763(-)
MAATGNPNPNNQFASLYVGDLQADVTEAVLYEIFNAVGSVASIRVCRDSGSRTSLGYAYVNFHNVADAEKALDTLNYSAIKGRQCRIMWSHRDPGLRKGGAGNVFVKNLDRTIDNKALYDTFSLFGNILSCKVATDDGGKSKGYGFVHYETDDAAKQAIERVNGMQIGEKTVFVGAFQKRSDRGTPQVYSNVYIKHLPESMQNEDGLKKAMAEFGEVTSVSVQTDKKNRSYAFCNYKDVESAAKAVAGLHQKDTRTEEQIAEYKKKRQEAGEDPEKDEVEFPFYRIYCQRHQSRTERSAELKKKFEPAKREQQGTNLYIKNLEDAVDDDKLKELFSPFGEITSVRVMRDEGGKSRGFGFVCFAKQEDATTAVRDMHLNQVMGKPLYVGLAERRDARMARLQQRFRTPGGMGGPLGKGMGPGGPPMYVSPGMRPGMPGPMGMRPMEMPRPGMMPFGMPGMMPGKGMPMFGKGMPPRPGMMPGMRPGMPGMMPGMRPMFGMPPGGKGGMPGMGMGAPGQARPAGPPAAGFNPGAPLTASSLAAAQPGMQKQMLGEKLFPLIAKMQPELAGKITGMMLEMDNSELLVLVESEEQLKHKVDEALRVLSGAQAS